MLGEVQPRRGLQTANESSVWRKHSGKRQDPRNEDERSEKISTRDDEDGARAQNGKLDKEQNRRDRIADEHRRCISRNECSDRRGLDAPKRPGGDQNEDDQQSDARRQEPAVSAPLLATPSTGSAALPPRRRRLSSASERFLADWMIRPKLRRRCSSIAPPRPDALPRSRLGRRSGSTAIEVVTMSMPHQSCSSLTTTSRCENRWNC